MAKRSTKRVISSYRLTHDGALAILQLGVARAVKIGKPVTITVVDGSGVQLASLRMDGAYVHSVESAHTKAYSAASVGRVTGATPDLGALKIGLATYGKLSLGIKGGVPIIVEGHIIGGIGVGSASGEEDEDIAMAGLKAINGAKAKF
jgi:uncharacterized protein GlcG (DUF336 family)